MRFVNNDIVGNKLNDNTSSLCFLDNEKRIEGELKSFKIVTKKLHFM